MKVLRRMAKSIEDIVREGYDIWRRNMLIGLPFISSLLLEILTGAFALILTGIILASLNIFFNNVLIIIAFLFLSLCLVVILLNIIKSFFIAGAVGMSKEAIETGRTSFGDMMKYGKRKFLELFIANMLIFALSLLGGIILIPSIIAFKLNMFNLALSLILVSSLLFGLYLICLNVVMILVPFSIVIRDIGGIDGLQDSYSVVMRNKLSVILLLFVSYGLTWAAEMLSNAMFSFFGIIPILGAIISLGFLIFYALFLAGIITPIITIWWTLLYIDRTGIKLEGVSYETDHKIPEEKLKHIITSEPIYV